MNCAKLFLASTLLSALAACPSAAKPEDIKVYLVRKTQQPPTLDGVLDEPCWQKAQLVKDFGYTSYFNKDRTLAIPASEARMLWDEKYLYVGLTAFEPDIEAVKRVVSNPGTSIFWRDLFEVHIDSNHDRKTRYQLMANPNGERYVSASFDLGHTIENTSSWGLWADWTAKARYGNDRWSVEIAVSFADMDVKPREGTHMGVNVARFRFVGGTQFLCWNGQGASHHDKKLWATAILVGSGAGTDPTQALRMVYPDMDQRVLRLLRPDGYTVLDRGRASDLNFADVVTREADRLLQLLENTAAQVTAADLPEADRKAFDKALAKQRKLVEEARDTAMAGGGEVSYVASRKALAAMQPVPEQLDSLIWQLKALQLALRLE